MDSYPQDGGLVKLFGALLYRECAGNVVEGIVFFLSPGHGHDNSVKPAIDTESAKYDNNDDDIRLFLRGISVCCTLLFSPKLIVITGGMPRPALQDIV